MVVTHRSMLMSWAALTLVGSAGLIVPPWVARARLVEEVGGLEEELSKPVDGPEVIDRLTADLERLREFGKGRMTPIPEESDVAGLMSLFSQTLTELGLEKRDITTRAPKTIGDPRDALSMPVTIVLSGPFPRVYEAVRRIESMPRLVRVERLRVTVEDRADQSSVASSEGLVRAELSIDAFYDASSGGGETEAAAAAGGGR